MKILFVCTGNICRSPMAEGILRNKFGNAGIKVETDSCGFESFHVGDNPDKRAQAVCGKYGIDISRHVARLFRKQDFDDFDRIYVMDSSHYYSVSRMARSAGDMTKVDYLLNIIYPGKNLPVDDPWYHDLQAFERTYKQLDAACDSLIEMTGPGKEDTK
ncbi:MAG: low molecular weight phosphotyrosine protein phosphatase [Bacteroidetes bacterium]|nr:low molecular weight phosphotyrosine protein phosphatase [Bacteroidota bacterium]